jgi:hypothetical protein
MDILYKPTLCPKCGKPNGKKFIGNGSYCKFCKNEYNKEHYKKNPECRRLADKRNKDRLRKIVIEAKSKPCADCGILYPWYVMDFDHLGDKSFTIADVGRLHTSKEKLRKEINKCDVVCSNCHRVRTYKRSTVPSSNIQDMKLRTSELG